MRNSTAPTRRSRIAWILTSVLAIALLVALGGCAAKRVAVTQDDSGGSVELDKKATLQVSLVANPSTGYSWIVVDDAGGILKQLGEPVVQDVNANANPSSVVGQSEQQVFQFDAAETGTGTLKMEYKRSWETTVPAEKTFSLDVTVK